MTKVKHSTTSTFKNSLKWILQVSTNFEKKLPNQIFYCLPACSVRCSGKLETAEMLQFFLKKKPLLTAVHTMHVPWLYLSSLFILSFSSHPRLVLIELNWSVVLKDYQTPDAPNLKYSNTYWSTEYCSSKSQLPLYSAHHCKQRLKHLITCLASCSCGVSLFLLALVLDIVNNFCRQRGAFTWLWLSILEHMYCLNTCSPTSLKESVSTVCSGVETCLLNTFKSPLLLSCSLKSLLVSISVTIFWIFSSVRLEEGWLCCIQQFHFSQETALSSGSWMPWCNS